MKKIILYTVATAAIISVVGCSSPKTVSHTETTTTQQPGTTTAGGQPVTTTTSTTDTTKSN